MTTEILVGLVLGCLIGLLASWLVREIHRPTWAELWKLSDEAKEVEGAYFKLRGYLVDAESALKMLYDKWEEGDACYEEPETNGGYLGRAFILSVEEENEILRIIERESKSRLGEDHAD